jgi:hypothetical protein
MQVHHDREAFEERSTRVVLIGFESQQCACHWKQQNSIAFPFLLDPERKVYQAYEIGRSFLRSFSPRNLWSYVKAFFQGRGIHAVQSDPNQLGADFIVDREGILQVTYYRQDPTYRPGVKNLLREIERVERESSRT